MHVEVNAKNLYAGVKSCERRFEVCEVHEETLTRTSAACEAQHLSRDFRGQDGLKSLANIATRLATLSSLSISLGVKYSRLRRSLFLTLFGGNAIFFINFPINNVWL